MPPLSINYLSLVLVAFLWGGTFVAGKLAAGTAPPEVLSFWRFMFASIVLIALRPGSIKLFNRQGLAPGILLGFFGAFSYNVCFFKALSLLPATLCALLVALNPIFITIGASVFFAERFSLKNIAGMVVSVIGVCWVITGGHFFDLSVFFNHGLLWMMGAVFSWATYTLLGKIWLSPVSQKNHVSGKPSDAGAGLYTAYHLVTLASVFGALGLLIYTVLTGNASMLVMREPLSWLSALYLGVLGTALAFFLYYRGVQKIGAARAASFNNLVPAFGMLLSITILPETLSIEKIFGIPVVILGLTLTNHRKKI